MCTRNNRNQKKKRKNERRKKTITKRIESENKNFANQTIDQMKFNTERKRRPTHRILQHFTEEILFTVRFVFLFLFLFCYPFLIRIECRFEFSILFFPSFVLNFNTFLHFFIPFYRRYGRLSHMMHVIILFAEKIIMLMLFLRTQMNNSLQFERIFSLLFCPCVRSSYRFVFCIPLKCIGLSIFNFSLDSVG